MTGKRIESGGEEAREMGHGEMDKVGGGGGGERERERKKRRESHAKKKGLIIITMASSIAPWRDLPCPGLGMGQGGSGLTGDILYLCGASPGAGFHRKPVGGAAGRACAAGVMERAWGAKQL